MLFLNLPLNKLARHPLLWLCEKVWTHLFLLILSITIHNSEDPLSISKLETLLAKPPHSIDHLWHPPLCCILLVMGGREPQALSKTLMCLLCCNHLMLFDVPNPTLNLAFRELVTVIPMLLSWTQTADEDPAVGTANTVFPQAQKGFVFVYTKFKSLIISDSCVRRFNKTLP